MLLNLLLSGADPKLIMISFLLTLPVLMLALSLHETAHGYAAWKCGDNTAYNLGRLTLNPLKHLDVQGFVCLLLFGFGWAKPVPINTRNFRNPKKGMAISALAGPLANLLLGLVCALLCGLCYGVLLVWTIRSSNVPIFLYDMLQWMRIALEYGALINFVFMIFNMIPVPPFDGSRIALAFLPPKAYFGLMRYERQIMFGILITLFVLSYVNISPFSFLAEKLTGVIVNPIAKLVAKAMLS